MSQHFDKQITQVRVTVSIFAPDGYKTVDLNLLDQTMMLLARENEDLVGECSGPDHCDPYAVLEYDTFDAALVADVDAERMRTEAVRLYEWVSTRKEIRDAHQTEWDKLDKRGVAIENDPKSAKPGEYKTICDEMERVQGLMDLHAPIEFDDGITSALEVGPGTRKSLQ